MRRILCLSVLLLTSFFHQPAAAIDVSKLTKEERIYAQMLANDIDSHIEVAAFSIHQKKIETQALGDIVGARLFRQSDGAARFREDVNFWLAKALGTTKKARYQPIAIAVGDSSLISRHVKKTMNQAAKQLKLMSLGQYDPEKVNLAAIPESLNQTRAQSIVDDKKFASIVGMHNLNHILEELGEPDSINVFDISDVNKVKRSADMHGIRLTYKNQGYIELQYVEPNKNWMVSYVKQDKHIPALPISHPLLSNYSLNVKFYIKRMFKRDLVSEQELDMVAEQILNNIDNPSYEDTLSWASRLLGKVGHYRYYETLHQLHLDSSSDKVKRYAFKHKSELVKSDVEQYKKGDIYKTLAQASLR